MSDLIQLLTGGMNANQRASIRHWLASLPEDEYLTIHQKALKRFYQLKQGHENVPGRILYYCGIVLSAREHGWDTLKGKGYRVAGSTQYDDWSRMRIIKIDNLRRNRLSPTKNKVLAYWGEVIELKKGGMGFRMIANYLKKYRRVAVSPAYIHVLWKKIEEGGQDVTS